MDIVMTLTGPSTRAFHATGVCSGFPGGLRPSYGIDGMAVVPVDEPSAGEWSGHEQPVVRPRPDAVSTLDQHAPSAPRRWSP